MKKLIIKILTSTAIFIPATALVSCGKSSDNPSDNPSDTKVGKEEIIGAIRTFRESIDDTSAPDANKKAIHICLRDFDQLYDTQINSERGEVTFYYESGQWRTSHSIKFAKELKEKFGMSNISLTEAQITSSTNSDPAQKELTVNRLREILQKFEAKIQDGTFNLKTGDRIVVNANKLDNPFYNEGGRQIEVPNYLDVDESLGQSEVKVS